MPLHALNASLPMEMMLLSWGTLAILLQPRKALSDTWRMLDESVRLMMFVQPRKQFAVINVYAGVVGKTREVNALQPWNAELPMLAIADPCCCCRFSAPANLAQPLNAFSPIWVILAGRMRPFGMCLPFNSSGYPVIRYIKLVPFPVLVEMPVISLQPANALFGMAVKLLFIGNTTVPFNAEQFSNADTPRDCNPGGK